MTSVFRGDGLWNTKGEAALSRILNSDLNDFSNDTKIQVGETTITRLAGEREIHVSLQNGERFTLSGADDLKRVIDAAGKAAFNSDPNIPMKERSVPALSINGISNFNQLISDGIYKYHLHQKSGQYIPTIGFQGGTSVVPEGMSLNKRMNKSDIEAGNLSFYNFERTVQADTNSNDENGKPLRTLWNGDSLTFENLGTGVEGITKPDQYMKENKLESLHCTELSCRYAARVSLLKSVGLIRPDATTVEVERALKQDRSNLREFVDQDMVARAQNGDWAKLTGAYQLQHENFNVIGLDKNNRSSIWLPLGNRSIQDHIKAGNILEINTNFPTGDGKLINHVTVVSRDNKDGTFGVDDTLEASLVPGGNLPLTKEGVFYGIRRRVK